jgi:hypothetical protein
MKKIRFLISQFLNPKNPSNQNLPSEENRQLTKKLANIGKMNISKSTRTLTRMETESCLGLNATLTIQKQILTLTRATQVRNQRRTNQILRSQKNQCRTCNGKIISSNYTPWQTPIRMEI